MGQSIRKRDEMATHLAGKFRGFLLEGFAIRSVLIGLGYKLAR
jgi:hypothetical protein